MRTNNHLPKLLIGSELSPASQAAATLDTGDDDAMAYLMKKRPLSVSTPGRPSNGQLGDWEEDESPECHGHDRPITETAPMAQAWNSHHKATNGVCCEDGGGDALSVREAMWVPCL